MEDYRSPRIYRIPYHHSQVLYVVYVSWTNGRSQVSQNLQDSIPPLSSLKGSSAPSLTTEPRLSHSDDFLGIYSGAPTRAHTLTQVHQGRGRRGGTFGAGPLSQPLLLSQVNGLSLNSSGGFHNLTVLSENPLAREGKLTDVPPQGKFGRPNHPSAHAPSIIALSAASIGVFSTFTVLVKFGTRQVGYTKAH